MSQELATNEREITFAPGTVRMCNQRSIIDGLSPTSDLMIPVDKEWVIRDVVEAVDMAIKFYLKDLSYPQVSEEEIKKNIENILSIFRIDCKKITIDKHVVPDTFKLSLYMQMCGLTNDMYMAYFITDVEKTQELEN